MEIKEYLFTRARCRQKHDKHVINMDPKYTQHSARNSPRTSMVQEGVKLKQIYQQKRNHGHMADLQIIQEQKLIF